MKKVTAVTRERDTFHRTTGWAAIAMLLFLRIPFSVFITYAYPSDEQWGPAIFQVGTYLLTAFLIWWERDALAEVHLDTLALLTILLFKPIQTLVLKYLGIDIPLAFPHPVGLLMWVIAAGLALAMWRSGYKPAPVRRSSLMWLGGGLSVGLLISVLPNLGVLLANARPGGYTAPVSLVTTTAAAGFFYQLGFSAVSEESLFRGFLWGYLRKAGWRERWIWLVQDGLFAAAHLYFKDGLPFHFWITIPALGLLFGLLAWRSRSITAGMMAHAAYNAGVYVILLALFAALFRPA
jgi:membrane protease YdiL (CAAX protease family)